MIFTDEQRKKAVSEFRKIKRRNIKSRIEELKKSNIELFKLWCYKKCIDDNALRRGGVKILLKLKSWKLCMKELLLSLFQKNKLLICGGVYER